MHNLLTPIVSFLDVKQASILGVLTV